MRIAILLAVSLWMGFAFADSVIYLGMKVKGGITANDIQVAKNIADDFTQGLDDSRYLRMSDTIRAIDAAHALVASVKVVTAIPNAGQLRTLLRQNIAIQRNTTATVDCLDNDALLVRARQICGILGAEPGGFHTEEGWRRWTCRRELGGTRITLWGAERCL